MKNGQHCVLKMNIEVTLKTGFKTEESYAVYVSTGRTLLIRSFTAETDV